MSLKPSGTEGIGDHGPAVSNEENRNTPSMQQKEASPTSTDSKAVHNGAPENRRFDASTANDAVHDFSVISQDRAAPQPNNEKHFVAGAENISSAESAPVEEGIQGPNPKKHSTSSVEPLADPESEPQSPSKRRKLDQNPPNADANINVGGSISTKKSIANAVTYVTNERLSTASLSSKPPMNFTPAPKSNIPKTKQITRERPKVLVPRIHIPAGVPRNNKANKNPPNKPTGKQLPSIQSILDRNKPKVIPPPPCLVAISKKLDFQKRPRPTRDGQGTIEIQDKNGLKITSDMKYLMMLYAIDMGYSIQDQKHYLYTDGSHDTKYDNSPSRFSRKNRKEIHEAACRIVCYDYGLLKPIGHTTLPKAFETFRKQKYLTTVNLFETRHQDRGRKSYIKQIEDTHPGYIKNLFLHAKERSDEYTKYDDYRRMMVERSKKLKPELDFKLSMNDLMMFFDKNPKLRPRGMPRRKRYASNSAEGAGDGDNDSNIDEDAINGGLSSVGAGNSHMALNHNPTGTQRTGPGVEHGFVANNAISNAGMAGSTGVAVGTLAGNHATRNLHGMNGDLNSFRFNHQFGGNVGNIHHSTITANGTTMTNMNMNNHGHNMLTNPTGGPMNTHLTTNNVNAMATVPNNMTNANLANNRMHGNNVGGDERFSYNNSGLGHRNGNLQTF